MRTAVCSGSFDPVTKGHIDIIKRSAGLVDKMIVAVFINPNKQPLFTIEERVALLEEAVKNRFLDFRFFLAIHQRSQSLFRMVLTEKHSIYLLGIEMPITEQVYRVLLGEYHPKEALRTLMNREKKAEVQEPVFDGFFAR